MFLFLTLTGFLASNPGTELQSRCPLSCLHVLKEAAGIRGAVFASCLFHQTAKPQLDSRSLTGRMFGKDLSLKTPGGAALLPGDPCKEALLGANSCSTVVISFGSF